MKKYEMQIDVTMGLCVEIEANSEEEAYQKIKGKQFTPSDLRNAWHVANNIVDVTELDN